MSERPEESLELGCNDIRAGTEGEYDTEEREISSTPNTTFSGTLVRLSGSRETG